MSSSQLSDTPEIISSSVLDESHAQNTFAASPLVRFPKVDRNLLDQDEEWCEVYIEGAWKRLRLHDYADIYNQPGLYEHLFSNLLECTSPKRIIDLLASVASEDGEQLTEFSAIDLGAGNGLISEQLRSHGVRHIVGSDIIPEAGAAAHRDRPGLYDDYVVADLCTPTDEVNARLTKHNPNLLVTASALGFGDIPPDAFWTGLKSIQTPGWVAFNIKADFLAGDDSTGFCRLIRALMDNEILELHATRRYHHRLNVQGQRLCYVAMIARKVAPLPEEILESIK